MFKRKLTALQFHNANAFDASGGCLNVININKHKHIFRIIARRKFNFSNKRHCSIRKSGSSL